MFVVVETGGLSAALNPVLLDYVKRNGFRLAWLERPLDRGEDGAFVTPPTDAEIAAGHEKVRGWLYRTVTDPMFFRSQRDEGSLDEWRAAVAAVKADWPARASIASEV